MTCARASEMQAIGLGYHGTRRTKRSCQNHDDTTLEAYSSLCVMDLKREFGRTESTIVVDDASGAHHGGGLQSQLS